MSRKRPSIKPPPVERPHQVHLSEDEIGALVKHHTRTGKAVVNRLGKVSLDMAMTFRSSRDMAILHQTAQGIIDHHFARAKELLQLLKPKP